jgi:hypothetical protein
MMTGIYIFKSSSNLVANNVGQKIQTFWVTDPKILFVLVPYREITVALPF